MGKTAWKKEKIFWKRVYKRPPRGGVSPKDEGKRKEGSYGDNWTNAHHRVYRWTLRQKAQDRELSAIRKENTLLTYGVLACLKGLEEQGCDGPVHEAIDKIERDLNLRAHDQEGNCG